MSDDAVFHWSLQVRKTTRLVAPTNLNNCIENLGLSKIQQPVFLWVLGLIASREGRSLFASFNFRNT